MNRRPTQESDMESEDSRQRATTEPGWLRAVLIMAGWGVVVLFLVFPLISVFTHALEYGLSAYLKALNRAEVGSAIRLTLFTAGVVVPLNLVFGVAAAWAVAKFEFRGKGLLLTLIDLPFSVSPVIVGLLFILVFGRQGWVGAWLLGHGYKIIFAWPGIILVTLFVTLPLVARALIPLMQSQGSDEEEAAVVLGASGWQMFWRVTLPKIKWGLLYGLVLCNARAMGEFGAVSVVSGHIRGQTTTIPLQIEMFYNEYNLVAAFALASLLSLLGLGTLVVKQALEQETRCGKGNRFSGHEH